MLYKKYSLLLPKLLIYGNEEFHSVPLLLKNKDVLDGSTVFHIFSYFLQILLYIFEILSKVAFQ